MRINNNISALNAWRNLNNTDNAMNKTLERLSSGLRINRAADDAAGLAVSEKMRAQIKGLNQAVKNAQDGISLIQTAEGALNETHAILQRMRELAVQSANGTLTADDRAYLQAEVAELISEVDRIANTTHFNGQVLFDGGFSTTGLSLHIGANAALAGSIGGTDNAITVTLADMTSAGTNLAISGIDISDVAGANDAIVALDDAIKAVSEERSNLGAVQNRLEHTILNLSVASENLSAAESRIRDADMAFEMSNFTKQQILAQAGNAMLAQANARPQAVLNLIR